MQSWRRIVSGLGRGVSEHHCGGGPERDSGHRPCSTKPKRPLRPEHCIVDLLRGLRQYSGDHEAART